MTIESTMIFVLTVAAAYICARRYFPRRSARKQGVKYCSGRDLLFIDGTCGKKAAYAAAQMIIDGRVKSDELGYDIAKIIIEDQDSLEEQLKEQQ